MTGDDAGKDYRARLREAARTIGMLTDRLNAVERDARVPIAVVGLGLRMPGRVQTPEEFWALLRDGVDATREFPAARGEARSLYHPDPEHPGTAYVIRGAFLDQVDNFDPAVFGISPREAVGMDPQQRIVLEIAWEALERAGYAPTSLAGSRTGVFVGVSTTDYVRMRQQLGRPDDVDAYQLVGEPSFIAGRVSYTLGLRGPASVIDTTCSSSLVAVHEACQALRAGECEMALAGGVSLMLSPYGFLLMSKFRALAADGRCKTFDASADGYARGEGAGLLVLKRLPDALASEDPVLAVIRGSAVNHDGRSSGLTVPNPEAQQDVIMRALSQADVAPADVSYAEAHGTGTSLGDPIELRALDGVMREGRTDTEPLLVGSVKTNIGHLEPAAGVAGLLKVILALRHGQIPPHLNLVTPNPKIPWQRLRIEVPTALRPWPRRRGQGQEPRPGTAHGAIPEGERPRIASVSSFGASGTNAYVVVTAPDPDGCPEPAAADDMVPGRPDAATDGEQLLVLSAHSGEALRELAARYVDYLAAGQHRLGDICFTSQTGRARLAHGLTVTGDSPVGMAGKLTAFLRGDPGSGVTETHLAPRKARKAAWLLSGQGSQYPGMASGWRGEPAFDEPFRECLELLDPLLPRPLADVLWGSSQDSQDQAIHDTRYTQPALFAVEYALGRMLMSWGQRPAALLGHSVGEIVAACLGGALDLPDAARLVAHRARLMAQLPSGGVMAAVSCDAATARAAITDTDDRVALAAVNGPADVVLSGASAEVREIAAELARTGHRTRFLDVSHAFHSPLVEPMLAEFGSLLGQVKMRAPEIPVLSNVSGRPWTAEELDPRYWLRHARGTVRFADGLRHLYDAGSRTFVELGPRPVLAGLGGKAISDPECAWIGLTRAGQDDRAQLLSAIGTLYLRGGAVDWPSVHGAQDRRRVPGPTYPWERKRFWFRPMEGAPGPVAGTMAGLGARVAGPEPAFTQQVEPERHLATTDDALSWLAERSVRAATAADGGRWGRLTGAAVHPTVPHQARGPWLIHSAVRPAADVAVLVETTRVRPAAAEAAASWLPHGAVTLTRPDHVRMAAPPADEAAAWGMVVRSVGTALIAAARDAGAAGGWVHEFAELDCDAPGDVSEVRLTGLTRSGAGFTASAELYADDGRHLGSARGLRWDPLPAPPASQWYPDDELLWRFSWVPRTAGALAAGPPSDPGHVLVVGSDRATRLIGEELRRQGVRTEFADSARDAPDEEIDGWLAAGPARIVLSGLSLPRANELSARDLRVRVAAWQESAIRLVRRIAARAPGEGAARIVLLTRAGVAVGHDQADHNPAAAAVRGLDTLIAAEHPACWGGAIDLDPAGNDDLPVVADAILRTGGGEAASEDQVAFRSGREYVARLTPLPAGSLPAPSGRRTHRPGTVLVVSGPDATGAVIAEWLVGAGTERIVLADSRPAKRAGQEPSPEGPAGDDMIARLRRRGVAVEHAQLDVTDQAEVAGLISDLADGPLPLRGVVHAVAATGPRPTPDARAGSIAMPWAPTVVGAWLLHEQTRHLDLDFFVCVSSAEVVLGASEQTGCSGAGLFLGGLARYRRASGLPGLTVHWGPWRQREFPSPPAADGRSRDGSAPEWLRPLEPAQCVATLDRMLRTGEPEYVVCAADWGRSESPVSGRPMFCEIMPRDGTASGEDPDLSGRLAALGGDSEQVRAVLAGYLGSTVAEALGTDQARVTSDADVFGLGLDSLMIMEIVLRCRRELNVSLRPGDFFARSTLAEWSEHLYQALRGGHQARPGGGSRPEERDDWEAREDPYIRAEAIIPRAALAADVQPDGQAGHSHDAVAAPGTAPVLLTGATGFVGAFLLSELLSATDAEVRCLTRCPDPGQGLARIRRNMARYEVSWPSDADRRVHVLPGDLGRPRLGLSAADYESLADDVGVIYHNGALVDFVRGFDQLAPPNIAGTEEILRLAVSGQPKTVNQVSTYAVWGLPAEGRDRIAETDDILTAGRLVNAYVQTKWGAEYLVRQARERGLPVRTFRLGRVVGDSATGAAMTTHFVCRVIKGCIQLGLAPDLDFEIEMTPVDYVARALVRISAGQSAEDIFHLVNPRRMPFAGLVRYIRQRGWQLKVVDRQDWWRALQDTFGVERNELHLVMDTVRDFIVGGERAIDYQVAATERALAGSGITCPPLDEHLLDRYFDYFLRSGYLE